ncbi:MAG TPA: hypothetical protein VMT22_23385 [Terriglobales bacterium]|nr:hypothetical protein [Terriglobales bacterium]
MAEIVVEPDLGKSAALGERGELDPLGNRVVLRQMGGKLQADFAAKNCHGRTPLFAPSFRS